MTRLTQLTSDQEFQFNQFLLDGTDRTLAALRNVFELNVMSSDSTISIAPSPENENLNHFGNGPLFIVSSTLAGDFKGNIALVFRWRDFKYLSEVMWPILSLMYMSKSDTELDSLEGHQPAWVTTGEAAQLGDPAYQEQMMDALAEMGNVLIGLYSKSMYSICDLNVTHTLPTVMKDPQQTIFRRMIYSANEGEQVHMAIENELFLEQGAMKLWCVISPTPQSFSLILDRLDDRNGKEDDDLLQGVNWV